MHIFNPKQGLQPIEQEVLHDGSVPDLLIILTLPGIYRRVVKRRHAHPVQERNVCDGRRAYSLSHLSGNGCGEIWENV
jgi:hypothetical protein